MRIMLMKTKNSTQEFYSASKALLSIAIFLTLNILSPMVSNAEKAQKKLTMEQAKAIAVDSYHFDKRMKWLEKDWDDYIKDAKEASKRTGKLVEADDKLRRYRTYLSQNDLRSMRRELDNEEAADYLLMTGRIITMEYVKTKVLADYAAVREYYDENDDLLREFYEFKLLLLPENLLDTRVRIDFIQSEKTGLKEAEATIKQRKAEIEKEKASVEVEVYKMYTDHIISAKSLRNAEKLLSASEKLYDKYKKMHDYGLISDLQYKEAEFEKNYQENEYKKATRNKENSALALKQALGMEYDCIFDMDEDIQLPEPGVLNEKDIWNEFEKRNITLLVMHETLVEPARVRFDIAERELNPGSKEYQELKDAKEKALLEYEKYRQTVKDSITQGLRAIRNIRVNRIKLKNNLDMLDLKIQLVKVSMEADMATKLDLLKVENEYNHLKCQLENLEYSEAYQQESLKISMLY